MLLLIFQIRSHWYALKASQVVEVIPRVPLRDVPNAPAFVSGLLNYRGIIIPVIDLGVFLEGKTATPHLSTRIMIIQYQPIQSHDVQLEISQLSISESSISQSSLSQSSTSQSSTSQSSTSQSSTSQPSTVQYIGLIAEQVTETLERSPSDIIDPTLPTQTGLYLGGMILDDRGMIQYLGMDKLVKNLGNHALLGLLSSS